MHSLREIASSYSALLPFSEKKLSVTTDHALDARLNNLGVLTDRRLVALVRRFQLRPHVGRSLKSKLKFQSRVRVLVFV